jgi:hypothetical protein
MAAALRPDDWDKPYYRPLGIRPVRNFLPTVITETAMHRWDIQSQLDTSPHLSPESLAVFMASMPRLRQFQPGPKLASPLRYRFEVSAPIPFQGDIVIAGDMVYSEPVGTAAPDLTFHCDTETFVLLMYGRLTYEASIANGRLVADGNRELVAKFARWLGP